MNIEYIPLRWISFLKKEPEELPGASLMQRIFLLTNFFYPPPINEKFQPKKNPLFIISLKAFYNFCKISIIKS